MKELRMRGGGRNRRGFGLLVSCGELRVVLWAARLQASETWQARRLPDEPAWRGGSENAEIAQTGWVFGISDARGRLIGTGATATRKGELRAVAVKRCDMGGCRAGLGSGWAKSGRVGIARPAETSRAFRLAKYCAVCVCGAFVVANSRF